MTRIAHVWYRRGLLDIPVKDFPDAFAIGRWIYNADLTADGAIRVRTTKGVETVEYRSRRHATHADAADLQAAPTVPAFPHDDAA